ncbi:Formamidopyrimidine-DNA glycosylase N-terminal domain-containing protein [Triangularia verruculosa]|uniref:Formamidopyrimidine-DNA glycosylase N-terminal domain-containing protein n=1 Tax=Triangularia verruculosa TaxID=2587418 RepID=A0AAN6X885_9PEZI|nr:Formamidopyrimidine-DNA glycosylase N-terminal domain-containing protein [Triangularia verruculosa]
MPEIAEIARIVHFLRLHLVGKTIATASAIDDANVFGKVGTTGAQVATALTGRKVISSGSQGKYFWITLDRAPHLVMHFGMTGWISIKGKHTEFSSMYRDTEAGTEVWPPKFTKFNLATSCNPPVEVAFTDPRRFGRVRLVDCPGDSIRQHSPLKENGPDPVVDTERFTLAYLLSKTKSRRVAIKALLLDQKVISGIGNWVADEVLFQSRLHPEQRCNSFTDDQIETLFEVIRDVCQTAVDKLGDYNHFPDDWLFAHRWGKGAKGSYLPNGEPLAFISVGGRTSCYAPGLQKKTGEIVAGAKEITVEDAQNQAKLKRPAKKEDAQNQTKPKTPAKKEDAQNQTKPKTGAKKEDAKSQTKPKRPAKKEDGKPPSKPGNKRKRGDEEDEEDSDDDSAPATKPKTASRRPGKKVKSEKNKNGPAPEQPKPGARRATKAGTVKTEKGTKDDAISVESKSDTPRRSGRLPRVR